jgi:putative sterol carrier protein
MKDISELFEVKLNQKLKEKPDLLDSLQAALQISVDDQTWHFDPQASGPWIFSGSCDNAECSISISTENFKKLMKGQLNIALAIALRKIKVKGNPAHLIALRKLFE